MMGNDFINCRDAAFVLEDSPREPRQARPRMVCEPRESVCRGWRRMLAWLRIPHPSAGGRVGVTGRR